MLDSARPAGPFSHTPMRLKYSESPFPFRDEEGNPRSRNEVRKMHLLSVLHHTKGDIKETSRLLGFSSRHRTYREIKEFGLESVVASYRAKKPAKKKREGK